MVPRVRREAKYSCGSMDINHKRIMKAMIRGRFGQSITNSSRTSEKMMRQIRIIHNCNYWKRDRLTGRTLIIHHEGKSM